MGSNGIYYVYLFKVFLGSVGEVSCDINVFASHIMLVSCCPFTQFNVFGFTVNQSGEIRELR